MSCTEKIVISASRRTDIPAFYMNWFMERIRLGFFETPNPYNGRIYRIQAAADRVHSIVFWSKNFGPFIRSEAGETLTRQGYRLYFQFTVNSRAPLLEPGIPSLQQRLEQLEYLCRHFNPATVAWRFDPICFYRNRNNELMDNLHDFTWVARTAARMGIRRCITSFMDHYPKIRQRNRQNSEVQWIDPPLETRVQVLTKLGTILENCGMALEICCEPQVLAQLGKNANAGPSSCISGPLLAELFGGSPCLKKDAGQRVKACCRCTRSRDIGSYRHHPCRHGCLYCYASPAKNAGANQKYFQSDETLA
jgi:hypothetical protein